MSTIGTEQRECSSFMKLPPEIRLEIYRLALEDTLDSPAMHSRVLRPRGALGLLLTNKLIRAESAKEMHPILR